MWSELGAPANLMYGQSGYDPIAAERKVIFSSYDKAIS